MKLRSLFLLAFGLSAALGGGAAILALSADRALAVPAVGGAVLAVAGLAWWLAARFQHQLSVLERVVAVGDDAAVGGVQIAELSDVAERLREHAYRWTEATTNNRRLSREIGELLERMMQSGAEEGPKPDGPAIGQLCRLLAEVAQAADSDLDEILASAREIRQSTQEIASGVDDQAASVNRTTTYVEQISSNIDAVSQNAEAAQRAAVSARQSAVEALDVVRELIQGMDRIRLHVEASEKKLRALGDRSHEIGSIVETIGMISSRTDLLALNASIESVRAGQHGRGFAVVAEEVRKLAEQAAQATREVAGLIESIQLETQESIAVMAEEHAQVEAEVCRVNAAGQALEQISRTSGDAEGRVGEISRAAQQQLQLTQEVVLVMERISEVAKQSRNGAEGLSWAAKTLAKLAQHLNSSLSPLRGCVSPHAAGRGTGRRAATVAGLQPERKNEPAAAVRPEEMQTIHADAPAAGAVETG